MLPHSGYEKLSICPIYRHCRLSLHRHSPPAPSYNCFDMPHSPINFCRFAIYMTPIQIDPPKESTPDYIMLTSRQHNPARYPLRSSMRGLLQYHMSIPVLCSRSHVIRTTDLRVLSGAPDVLHSTSSVAVFPLVQVRIYNTLCKC
jgi:hypothetical protein